MSEAKSAAGLTKGWLKDGVFDISLIVGIVMMAALVAGVARLDPLYFQILVVADLWLLGYHHVFATFTKLAGTPVDRRHNAVLIWFLLPAVLGVSVLVGYLYGIIAIVTVYFFWQWFHYVRQSWGIAKRYYHRSGVMGWDDTRWSELTLWSVPIWGLLNRCHQNPDTFLTMPVWMPAVPLVVVQAAGVMSVGLVSWWVVTRIRAWQRGTLALGHTLYMISHFVVFACGYVLIDNVSIGWLMVNVWHNTQYIVFVWMHNRQRFEGKWAAQKSLFVWLSQPGVARAVLYFMVSFLMSTALYYNLVLFYMWAGTGLHLTSGDMGVTSVTFLILFAMGINFHHYVVDGIIWKRKHEIKA